MNEKQIRAFLEENVKGKDQKKLEKMQYTMDFGEIAIQYDFCLN